MREPEEVKRALALFASVLLTEEIAAEVFGDCDLMRMHAADMAAALSWVLGNEQKDFLATRAFCEWRKGEVQ